MADPLTLPVRPNGAGGAFDSLAAAVQYIKDNYPDLTQADKYALIEIGGTWNSPDIYASIDTIITDATRFISIYTLPTARHTGKVSTGKYRIIDDGSGFCIAISSSNVRVSGIIFDVGYDSEIDSSGINSFAASNWISKCIFRTVISAGAGVYCGIIGFGSYDDFRAYNNLFYDFEMFNNIGIFTNNRSFIHNNTFYNCYYPVLKYWFGPRDITYKNNLERGCVSDGLWAYTNDSDYNSSHLYGAAIVNSPRINTEPPWWSGGTSDSDMFVDPGGRDLHLKPGGILTGMGANLSQDPDCPVLDDIDSANRDEYYDIGADECLLSNAVPLIMYNRMHI